MQEIGKNMMKYLSLQGAIGTFYACYIIQLGVIFSGFTILLNRLNVVRNNSMLLFLMIEIFLNLLCCLLFCWFIYSSLEYSNIWKIWVIGG